MSENKYLPIKYRIDEVRKNELDRYIFTVKYDEVIKTGQFFMAAIPNYKEIPIYPYTDNEGSMTFEIKKPSSIKEEVFSESKGRYFYIRGPYGKSLNLEKEKKAILIMDEKGIMPLMSAAKFYRGQNLEILYFSKNKLREIEEMSSENTKVENRGEFDEKAIENIEIKDKNETFCLVALEDEYIEKTAEKLIEKGIEKKDIYIIKNRNIVCGMGKCGHCRSADLYSCTDGPAFSYEKLEKLID